jgi:small-conductance mechanosensitive channel
LKSFLDSAGSLAPFLAVVAAALTILLVSNQVLRRRWKDQPDAQFQFQLIMLALTLVCVLVVVAALPVSDTLRGQFLSLIGILLSAAIALASTTFIGNIMAGVMLKAIRKARPGDFITVEDLTGRITEMDLLHTEIQTEFRDLVTVPNSYLVARPLKVVRASGSIITAEVSLGYDVPHTQVFQLLKDAATASGLTDCFVHIRQLGDFAITYRAAGLLEDISSLISARSKLMASLLEALHGAGIEIVSPAHLNTRMLEPGARILPPITRESKEGTGKDDGADESLAEAVAFDKAEDAASAEKLRRLIEATEEEIDMLRGSSGDHAGAIEEHKVKLERLGKLLRRTEAQVKARDGGDQGPTG